MLGIRGQEAGSSTIFESGSSTIFYSGRSSMLTPTAKEGLDRLRCRSLSETNCSVVSSEASVLVAVFERAACCSVESAEGVGEWKRALIISLRCAYK